MADPQQLDKTSAAYWDQFGPEAGKKTAPAGTAAAPAAPGQVPSDSIDWGREAILGGDQFVIGAAGLPATVARLPWQAAHALAPSYIGSPPEILSPEGPGGYANRLTIPGYEPGTAAERTIAAGARGAGAGAWFGPLSAAISGVGSGTGQGLTEAGFDPRIGETVGAVSGLGGGLWGALRGKGIAGIPISNPLGWFGRGSEAAAPVAAAAPEATAAAPGGSGVLDELLGEAPESNVIPFPAPRGGAAPAARPAEAPAPAPTPAPAPAPAAAPAASSEAVDVSAIRHLAQNEERRAVYGPLTGAGILNPWNYLRVAQLRALSPAYRAPSASPAADVARKILGPAAGVATGATTGQQVPPGGISYSYVPPPRPQLGPQPFMPRPLQLAPQRTDQPGPQSYLGGTLR